MLKTNYLTNNSVKIMGTIIPKTINKSFCKSCMVLILSFMFRLYFNKVMCPLRVSSDLSCQTIFAK